MQNSDSLVNCMTNNEPSAFDSMVPVRPSNQIWQLPYEERKSMIQ